MATEKMNLISMMNQAWERKHEVSAEEFEIKIKNLISHAFVEIEKLYVDFCKSKGYEYKDDVFYIFQRLFIYFIFTDGDFLQGEYDAYVKFCNWAKILRRDLGTTRLILPSFLRATATKKPSPWTLCGQKWKH